MRTFTLDNLTTATGGSLTGGPARLEGRGVSTDTRAILPGEVFFALKGDTFDGEAFVGQAFESGAAAAVVSEAYRPPAAIEHRPLIRVSDVTRALGDFAAWYRHTCPAAIIGITGSCGKTTTREMTYHALADRLSGVKSPRSFNNHIGVPLTLFHLEPADDFGVIEMGTNHFGEIARLTEIAAPEIGVITTIADAHLEHFGSRDGVAREKGSLIAALPPDGTAILNADNEHCRRLARTAPCRVVTFGCETEADFRATGVVCSERRLSFELADGTLFEIPVFGRANAMNALACTAVAAELGVAPAETAERLRTLPALPMRMEWRRYGGVNVVCDQYNSNPASLRAALSEYRALDAPGRKVLVVGSMLELGDCSAESHEALGREIAEAGFDLVWTVGDEALGIAGAARDRGMPDERVFCCRSAEQARDELPAALEPNDTLLLKASRAIGLEAVLEGIEERFAASSAAVSPERFESYR